MNEQKVNFAVLDMETGGMDGWYGTESDARHVAESWNEKLGGNSVIVITTSEMRPIKEHRVLINVVRKLQ